MVYTYSNPASLEIFRFSTLFSDTNSTARGNNLRVSTIKGRRNGGEKHTKKKEQIEDIPVFSRRREILTLQQQCMKKKCHVKFKQNGQESGVKVIISKNTDVLADFILRPRSSISEVHLSHDKEAD